MERESMYSFEGNRVVGDSGARYPIFNAPIGYFARGALAGAVSAAGGMGLLETSSTGLAETQAEYDRIRQTTDAPFGVQLFLRVLAQQGRLDEVLDWALDGRAGFLVTCVGAPGEILPRVRDAGVKLYHQTGSLNDALRAVDAGADGLIVEGAESGGLRSTRSLHLFSFLQQVRSRVDVPLVAGGGIVDGKGMAGAFALGAEGVMMGTRFITSAESPVHLNVKEAIAQADETVNLEPVKKGIMMRFVRNEMAEAVARGEIDPKGQPYAGPVLEMFENGDLSLAMVGAGESAALLTEIKTAAEIIDDTVTGFWREVERVAALLGPGTTA
ncbi:MAG: NAD(P)H-dependent flavin oxidoreductase [Acidimicrobiales bacterium]